MDLDELKHHLGVLASQQPAQPHQLLQVDPMQQLMLQAGASPVQANRLPANVNTSQETIRAMIPPPLNMFERAWQNYGKYMNPEDVLGSEITWSAAAQARDKGTSPHAMFANMANYLWEKMGFPMRITPEQAHTHMEKNSPDYRQSNRMSENERKYMQAVLQQQWNRTLSTPITDKDRAQVREILESLIRPPE